MVKRLWFRLQQCFVLLACCLAMGPLKWELLDIYFFTYIGVRNFRNTSAMRVIFFLKMFKM